MRLDYRRTPPPSVRRRRVAVERPPGFTATRHPCACSLALSGHLPSTAFLGATPRPHGASSSRPSLVSLLYRLAPLAGLASFGQPPRFVSALPFPLGSGSPLRFRPFALRAAALSRVSMRSRCVLCRASRGALVSPRPLVSPRAGSAPSHCASAPRRPRCCALAPVSWRSTHEVVALGPRL